VDQNQSEHKTLNDQLNEAVSFLNEAFQGEKPEIGIVLGSGLNSFAEAIEEPQVVDYNRVPHMQVSTAAGHRGRFVLGNCHGKKVLAMQGRLHGYEGYTAQEVAFPIWLMKRFGVETLITTNAAGAINELFHVGDFCVMTDQINYTGRNPVSSQEAAEIGPRFFSMLDAFDSNLRMLAHVVAAQCETHLREGVYLGLLGPSFETPAEIRMFKTMGADTVAMSVIEEVIAARQMNMRVLGISLISNMACGIHGASPSDEEVRDVAKTKEEDFARLIGGILERL
jgi:purine-nucleoside phosphorylase